MKADAINIPDIPLISPPKTSETASPIPLTRNIIKTVHHAHLIPFNIPHPANIINNPRINMKYPKIRELIEAIKALVKGPYTSQFPRKPIEPAKRFRGKPEYSNEGCIACTACSLVCPVRAIEFRDTITKDAATRKMVLHLDECHYCGQCSALCTTREDNPPGIKHTTEFDLAGFDRNEMVSTTDEKELALCEICGDVITAKAHISWLVKRLGPLAFSNRRCG